jgi:ubiquinone/menaquinone biosynthesis C-methylase UbiE
MTATEPAFDAEAFKTATRTQWDKSAGAWNDSTAVIRPWLSASTEAMLNMAGVVSGARVLDVAAGAGDQTLDIARRVGPTGFVLATDLSAAILEFAKRNATEADCGNVSTRVADGENLDVESSSFDAAVCRLGLMFFPNPLRGLSEIWRVLKPDARLCTVVFSSPDANPCVRIVLTTALQHAGLPQRDPYQPGGLLSLGKPGLIDDLFRQAGFREVATTKMAAPFKLPSAERYLDFIRTSAGPVLQILAKLNEAARQAAWAEMESKLQEFNTAGGWEGPNELLLTAGRH